MEILGVGLPEMAFILIIALILLGPKDMQKTGRVIGRWLRKIVTSDGWRLFQQTSREIQTLPNRLMREAALDELKEMQGQIGQDLRQTADSVRTSIQPPRSVASGQGAPVSQEPAAIASPPPQGSEKEDRGA